MKHGFAALAMAGLMLAQMNTPGSYNLGIPAVPGTRVPESNSATAVSPSQSPALGNSTAPGTGAGAAGQNAAPATGISFGAAPPPLISPNR